MEPRLTVLTLGVTDVAAARRFYLDGLGWVPTLDAGEVVFLQIAPGVLLALWDRDALADDAGTARGPQPPAPVSLGHNVGSAAEVAAVVERMRAAGGEVVREPAAQPWGGVSGYVADPDGFRWEVVWNPGLTVDPDGTVRLSAPET